MEIIKAGKKKITEISTNKIQHSRETEEILYKKELKETEEIIYKK